MGTFRNPREFKGEVGFEGEAVPAVSHEHKGLGTFALDAIDALPMPEGYRRSIRRWAKLRQPRG